MQRGTKSEAIKEDSLFERTRQILGDKVMLTTYNDIPCIYIPSYDECVTAVTKMLGVNEDWYRIKFNL